jgi:hypothetical protein
MAFSFHKASSCANPGDDVRIAPGHDLRPVNNMFVQMHHCFGALIFVSRHSRASNGNPLGGKLVEISDVMETRPGIDDSNPRSPTLI